VSAPQGSEWGWVSAQERKYPKIGKKKKKSNQINKLGMVDLWIYICCACDLKQ
jgi:hypothetical protein